MIAQRFNMKSSKEALFWVLLLVIPTTIFLNAEQIRNVGIKWFVDTSTELEQRKIGTNVSQDFQVLTSGSENVKPLLDVLQRDTIVLVFDASCSACVTAAKMLDFGYTEQLSKKNIDLMILNNDQQPQAVLNALREVKIAYAYTPLVDTVFTSLSKPLIMKIDKQGKVLAVETGWSEQRFRKLSQ